GGHGGWNSGRPVKSAQTLAAAACATRRVRHSSEDESAQWRSSTTKSTGCRVASDKRIATTTSIVLSFCFCGVQGSAGYGWAGSASKEANNGTTSAGGAASSAATRSSVPSGSGGAAAARRPSAPRTSSATAYIGLFWWNGDACASSSTCGVPASCTFTAC